MEVKCCECAVAKTCPNVGSSPMSMKDGRQFMCRIIGGYGRKPVDEAALSKESLSISKRDGPCLTIAETPFLDESGSMIEYRITKIFSKAVLTARETNPTITSSDIVPKSFKQ